MFWKAVKVTLAVILTIIVVKVLFVVVALGGLAVLLAS